MAKIKGLDDFQRQIAALKYTANEMRGLQGIKHGMKINPIGISAERMARIGYDICLRYSNKLRLLSV